MKFHALFSETKLTQMPPPNAEKTRLRHDRDPIAKKMINALLRSMPARHLVESIVHGFFIATYYGQSFLGLIK